MAMHKQQSLWVVSFLSVIVCNYVAGTFGNQVSSISFLREINAGVSIAENRSDETSNRLPVSTDSRRLLQTRGMVYGAAKTADVMLFDGMYHNLGHPDWGRIEGRLVRTLPHGYADGVREPAGPDRPNPRELSKELMSGQSGRGSYRNRTAMLVYFGQQLVEEILDSQVAACPFEYFNIPIKKCDPLYDIDCKGTVEIPLPRIRYASNTGVGPGNPREFINEVTPWLDGSSIYGTSKAWCDALRSFVDGKLLEDRNRPGYPPLNDIGLPMFNPPPPLDHHMKTSARLFRLGNPRGSENPYLLSFQIIWFRYHNWMCDQLKEAHPDWRDEQLFHRARQFVVAVYQRITLYEWLPAWLGPSNLTEAAGLVPPYTRHNPKVFPGIPVEFQSAAMRFGHTMVTPGLFLRDRFCNFKPAGPAPEADPHTVLSGKEGVRTCNSYWESPTVLQHVPVEQVIMGMASTRAEAEDNIVTEDLRGFVFGPLEFSRRDLMAINIQRGRETGLPDYNTARRVYNLDPVDSFSDIVKNMTGTDADGQPLSTSLAASLASLYKDVNDTDIWVGGLLETTKDGPGPLFRAIILRTFLSIRDGDRWWYENQDNGLFSEEEMTFITSTSLADVLRSVDKDGLMGETVQDEVFQMSSEDKHCPQTWQLRAQDLPACTPQKGHRYWPGNDDGSVVFITCGAVALLAALVTLAYYGVLGGVPMLRRTVRPLVTHRSRLFVAQTGNKLDLQRRALFVEDGGVDPALVYTVVGFMPDMGRTGKDSGSFQLLHPRGQALLSVVEFTGAKNIGVAKGGCGHPNHFLQLRVAEGGVGFSLAVLSERMVPDSHGGVHACERGGGRSQLHMHVLFVERVLPLTLLQGILHHDKRPLLWLQMGTGHDLVISSDQSHVLMADIAEAARASLGASVPVSACHFGRGSMLVANNGRTFKTEDMRREEVAGICRAIVARLVRARAGQGDEAFRTAEEGPLPDVLSRSELADAFKRNRSSFFIRSIFGMAQRLQASPQHTLPPEFMRAEDVVFLFCLFYARDRAERATTIFYRFAEVNTRGVSVVRGPQLEHMRAFLRAGLPPGTDLGILAPGGLADNNNNNSSQNGNGSNPGIDTPQSDPPGGIGIQEVTLDDFHDWPLDPRALGHITQGGGTEGGEKGGSLGGNEDVGVPSAKEHTVVVVDRVMRVLPPSTVIVESTATIWTTKDLMMVEMGLEDGVGAPEDLVLVMEAAPYRELRDDDLVADYDIVSGSVLELWTRPAFEERVRRYNASRMGAGPDAAPVLKPERAGLHETDVDVQVLEAYIETMLGNAADGKSGQLIRSGLLSRSGLPFATLTRTTSVINQNNHRHTGRLVSGVLNGLGGGGVGGNGTGINDVMLIPGPVIPSLWEWAAQACSAALQTVVEHQIFLAWLTLLIAVEVGLFSERYTSAALYREHRGLRRVTGVGSPLAHASGALISFNISTLLVFVCNHLLTYLRNTPFGRVMPVDSALFFHKLLGTLALGAAGVHAAAHVFNIFDLTTQPPADLGCYMRELFLYSDEVTSFATFWSLGTLTGFTGWALLLVLSPLAVFSLCLRRESYYRAFQFSHDLYLPAYVLLVLHSIPGIVARPSFHWFLIGPGALYIINWIVSRGHTLWAVRVLRARRLPGNVLQLVLERPRGLRFESGQYVKLSCPLVDSTPHPFYLTSAPDDEAVQIHMRVVGPWTRKVFALYNPAFHDSRAEEEGSLYPQVYVGGPFGKPLTHEWGESEALVIVAGGAGVPPAASMLRDVLHRIFREESHAALVKRLSERRRALGTATTGNLRATADGMPIPQKHVYFYWVATTLEQWEWFLDVLRELEEGVTASGGVNLEMAIFVTRHDAGDLRTQLALLDQKELRESYVDKPSFYTGLRSRTYYAAPMWNKILASLRSKHPRLAAITVSATGPPELVADVRTAVGVEAESLAHGPMLHFVGNTA